MKVLDRAISSQMLLSLLITVSDCMVLTKFQQRNVNHRWSEVFVDDHLAHSDLGPSKYLSSVPVITDCDPIPNLLASLVFLLLWTPSMMEKEEAGSISSLSSLNRQWAAVSANRLPICEQQLDEQTNKQTWQLQIPCRSPISNKTAHGEKQWSQNYYQHSATFTIDVASLVITISEKRSNPRVGILLKKNFWLKTTDSYRIVTSAVVPPKIRWFLWATPHWHSPAQSRADIGYGVIAKSEVSLERRPWLKSSQETVEALYILMLEVGSLLEFLPPRANNCWALRKRTCWVLPRDCSSPRTWTTSSEVML